MDDGIPIPAVGLMVIGAFVCGMISCAKWEEREVRDAGMLRVEAVKRGYAHIEGDPSTLNARLVWNGEGSVAAESTAEGTVE